MLNIFCSNKVVLEDLVDKEGMWYSMLKSRYDEKGGRLKEGGRHGSLWWRMSCNVCGVLVREWGVGLKVISVG